MIVAALLIRTSHIIALKFVFPILINLVKYFSILREAVYLRFISLSDLIIACHYKTRYMWQIEFAVSINIGHSLFSSTFPSSDYLAVVMGHSGLHLGAQWLSGRELDSRPKGRGFKPHRRH